MKYFKKLEGNKIYLSPLSLDDAELYTKWLNDRKVTDGLNCTNKITNIESEKEWITKSLEKCSYTFAIVLNDNDMLIGNCGIMNYDGINRTATLGIFIGEEENRGKGYGKEAIELLLEYGFNTLNLHNINLEVFAFNENAISCYKKLGFKECGRRHECYFLNGKYHDEIMMEILEDDYRKKAIPV